MLKNYLTVAIRNLFRHRAYSCLNMLGLSIGMACCVLAVLFIQHELSFESFHSNADHIYRIVRSTQAEDGSVSYHLGSSGALSEALRDGYPDVEHVTRIWKRWGLWIHHGKEGFNKTFCLVDPDFLNMFNFTLLNGDIQSALKEPGAILITQEMARQYFGDEDPTGKILTIDHRYFKGDYTVTGILKDMPTNTNLGFDCLSITKQGGYLETWIDWRRTSAYRPVDVFVQLKKGTDLETFESQLADLMHRHMGPEISARNAYHLHPLNRQHLYTRHDYNVNWYGDIHQIYLFSAITFFILLIACINFMNLATARSVGRSREVGLRKVVGAYRTQLIHQFLGESLLLSIFALLFALALVQLALPEWNAFLQEELSLTQGGGIVILASLTAITLFVGLLAGSYPALFLSAFQPTQVLKGTASSGGARIRKMLVVFQFAISILFIVSTGFVYQQLDYIHNKKLGFDKEHIVATYLFNTDRSLAPRYNQIKRDFLQHPNILKATAYHTYMPGGHFELYKIEGMQTPARMRRFAVDEDFFDTFNIPLVAGRTFSADIVSDTTQAFILNETAVKKFGWDNPIGQSFEWAQLNRKGTVIGVVKDFHFQSLHSEIEPAFFCMWQPKLAYLTMKISGNNIPETLSFIRQKWSEYIPNEPPNIWFLDEGMERLYREETRFANITTTFSLLAIFVACLGLLGLAAFTAEQRTKEIGIRKVLGASVPALFFLLSKDFLKLVLIANLIAWPIVYYTMQNWLANFAYRIDLNIGVFLLGGILAFFIALASVGLQAFKSARSNPIDALRYE